MISDDDSFPVPSEMSEIQMSDASIKLHGGPELRVFKLGNVHLASVYYIHIYTYIHIHIYVHIYIYNIYIYIYT